MYMYMSNPTRGSSFFFGKVTGLGVCCVALPCCLFDLAYFFLPSFSSLIKTCTCTLLPICTPLTTCTCSYTTCSPLTTCSYTTCTPLTTCSYTTCTCTPLTTCSYHHHRPPGSRWWRGWTHSSCWQCSSCHHLCEGQDRNDREMVPNVSV